MAPENPKHPSARKVPIVRSRSAPLAPLRPFKRSFLTHHHHRPCLYSGQATSICTDSTAKDCVNLIRGFGPDLRLHLSTNLPYDIPLDRAWLWAIESGFSCYPWIITPRNESPDGEVKETRRIRPGNRACQEDENAWARHWIRNSTAICMHLGLGKRCAIFIVSSIDIGAT